jgi:hypothetical protein
VYDPTTATWPTEDPDGFAAGDDNLERYAGNDPANATDPSGLVLWVRGAHAKDVVVGWYADEGMTVKPIPFPGKPGDPNKWFLLLPIDTKEPKDGFLRQVNGALHDPFNLAGDILSDAGGYWYENYDLRRLDDNQKEALFKAYRDTYGEEMALGWAARAGWRPEWVEAAPEPSNWTRAVGGLQILGGVAEYALAGTLWAAPEPFLSKPAAVIVGAHGTDNILTGGDKVWSGLEQKTYTARYTAAGLEKLGVEKRNAEALADGLDGALNWAPVVVAVGEKVGQSLAAREARLAAEAQAAERAAAREVGKKTGLEVNEAEVLALAKSGQRIAPGGTLRGASQPTIPPTSAGVKDWGALEEQMTAHINQVAEGLGVPTERAASAAGRPNAGTWRIDFLQTQGSGDVQFATVVESPSGGGRILFDQAIVFPAEAGSPELAKLPLNARIQVILTHEITEGNVARTLRLGPGQMVDKTHDLSLLTSPYSDLAKNTDPGVVKYLLKWKEKGGSPPQHRGQADKGLRFSGSLRGAIAMRGVQLDLQSGLTPTSVRVRLTNRSAGIVSVSAPNPYVSVSVFDKNRQPYPRVRAVAWKHSRKTCQIAPSDELYLTIDLKHYWDEISGEVIVRVQLEITEESGGTQEHVVEGGVCLNVPSYPEKYAEMKKRPRPQGVPMKVFDVSDSTQFERPDSQ